MKCVSESQIYHESPVLIMGWLLLDEKPVYKPKIYQGNEASSV